MDSSSIPDLVYNTIKYGTLLTLSIGLLVLFVTSAIIHDTYWIETHPAIFTKETLVMALLASVPILYISYQRGGTLQSTLLEFSILFCKMAVIHITLQLSGVYSVLFPKSANPVHRE